MKSRRQYLQGALSAAAVLAALPRSLLAQGQPLKILVGYPPGGAVDVVAREVGEALRRAGTATIVENRSGASGRLATDLLLQSPADGNTLVLMPGGNVTIFEHVYPNLKYKLTDLAPLATVCSFQFGLAVGPGAPVKTLAEFVDWAKANKGRASYGSPGGGTAMHFMGVMFARKAGIDFQHVPYRGGAAAMTDVLGGSTSALATTLPNLVQPHKSGRLRILAFTGEARLSSLPDVPTFKELGYADLVLDEVFGLFAKAATPEPILQRLEQSSMQAARQPQVVAALERLEFDSQVMGRSAFGGYLRSGLGRWGPIVKSTGYKADE